MLRTSDEAFKRLVVEQQELENKIDKLEAFIKKCRQNKVQNITLDDIHLLEEQLKYMQAYNGVLKCRIGRVEKVDE
jgi:uncharacterized protein YdcH (DUF465 family)